MERKIRSKNGSVEYITGLINNEIKDLCDNYEDSKLTLCKPYKEILEEKSASIILLWEEILNDIDDDDEHIEEFQKRMVFQLKVKHQIKMNVLQTGLLLRLSVMFVKTMYNLFVMCL